MCAKRISCHGSNADLHEVTPDFSTSTENDHDISINDNSSEFSINKNNEHSHEKAVDNITNSPSLPTLTTESNYTKMQRGVNQQGFDAAFLVAFTEMEHDHTILVDWILSRHVKGLVPSQVRLLFLHLHDLFSTFLDALVML